MLHVIGRVINVLFLVVVLQACAGGGGTTVPISISNEATSAHEKELLAAARIAAAPASNRASSSVRQWGCPGDVVTNVSGGGVLISHLGSISKTCKSTAPSSTAAPEDAAKTIQAILNTPVNAITYWYFLNCSTSGGTGSMSYSKGPQFGTVSIASISAPVPGCPVGSPALPATQSLYKWTNPKPTKATDFFVIDYSLFGVNYLTDITALLGPPPPPPSPPPSCTLESKTSVTVPQVPNSRTRIGIGEFVTMSVKNDTSPDVKWSAAGGVKITSKGLWAAPYTAGPVTISAELANHATCKLLFSVVPPENIDFYYMSNVPFGFSKPSLRSLNPFFNVALWSAILVRPADVSFKNVHIREHDFLDTRASPDYHFPNPITDRYITVPNGSNGWLIGCDNDVLGVAAGIIREFPDPYGYWSYLDYDNGGKEITFVEELQTLIRDSNSVTYLKYEISGLSDSGAVVPQDGQGQKSILTVPLSHAPQSRPATIPCEADVRAFFSRS